MHVKHCFTPSDEALDGQREQHQQYQQHQQDQHVSRCTSTTRSTASSTRTTPDRTTSTDLAKWHQSTLKTVGLDGIPVVVDGPVLKRNACTTSCHGSAEQQSNNCRQTGRVDMQPTRPSSVRSWPASAKKNSSERQLSASGRHPRQSNYRGWPGTGG